MKQSRVMSMIEAATNVVVGYLLAIATQIVVFPWFGIETGLAEHMTIGLAFVGCRCCAATRCGDCSRWSGCAAPNERPPPPKDGGLHDWQLSLGQAGGKR